MMKLPRKPVNTISTIEVSQITPRRKVTFRRVFWPLFFMALVLTAILAIIFATQFFRG